VGLRWRVLIEGAHEGAVNMARDHALAVTLAPDGAVLRFYRWDRPTLSLGRHEPARHRWNARSLAEHGVGVVRRPTGGRAVLHHRELTYAVVLPLSGRPGLRDHYRAINQALVHGLEAMGVPARVVGAEGVVAPLEAGPCFAGPAPGEVAAAGRKLIGSAQARVEGRLLQHGSILIENDQARLASFALPGGVEGPAAQGIAPATLAALLDPPPAPDDLARALVGGFRAVFSGDWPGDDEWGTLTPEIRAAEDRLRSHYASEAWTWRR
jgi:lipoyl(octanoyl) transferase